jgi:hypothetical protein
VRNILDSQTSASAQVLPPPERSQPQAQQEEPTRVATQDMTESQLNGHIELLLREAAEERRKWDSFLVELSQDLRGKLGDDWQSETEPKEGLKKRRI